MPTLVEQILARASDRARVEPGEVVVARVDLALANDFTAPIALRQMRAAGADRVFDPQRICIVAGRHLPAKDPGMAMEIGRLERFCAEQGITHFYGRGGEGMDHALVPELGLVRPGMLVCNADSHAATIGALGCLGIPMGSTDIAHVFAFGETWLKVPPTIRVRLDGKAARYVTSKDLALETLRRLDVDGAQYCCIEFEGDALAEFSVDERFTLTNMAIEMGAKSAVMLPDPQTDAYLRERGILDYPRLKTDSNADVVRNICIDAGAVRPQVAVPPRPSNVCAVQELPATRVTHISIGTCTNGRLIDLQQAAEVLRGRRVASGVRLVVTPATARVYREAMKGGLLEVFLDAGAMVVTPGCGACGGHHQGVLGADDVCVATHNRNFKGRMGHPEAKIYLSSPYVAAASAVAGCIASPVDVL